MIPVSEMGGATQMRTHGLSAKKAARLQDAIARANGFKDHADAKDHNFRRDITETPKTEGSKTNAAK